VAVRAAWSVAVLWGAVTATFALLHMMPGSTADILLAGAEVSPAERASLIAGYRLGDPLIVQYLAYLGRIVRGQFGDSYVLREPVWSAVGAQLPSTLALIAVTLGVTVVAGVAVAVATASRRSWVQSLTSIGESLVVAIPPVWLGLLLLTAFSFRLHWFPAIGSNSAAGLVLPALTLAAAPAAVLSRVLREGLLSALGDPFVVTARSRGISELALRTRHVLRHGLVPATALLGWTAGTLIGGTVIIETVFARQGIGQLLLTSVQNKDMPVVIAVVLLAATAFVVINIAVDVLTWLIDPRTRDVVTAA
jgi:peptide/nickel transport system permease protein